MRVCVEGGWRRPTTRSRVFQGLVGETKEAVAEIVTLFRPRLLQNAPPLQNLYFQPRLGLVLPRAMP